MAPKGAVPPVSPHVDAAQDAAKAGDTAKAADEAADVVRADAAARAGDFKKAELKPEAPHTVLPETKKAMDSLADDLGLDPDVRKLKVDDLDALAAQRPDTLAEIRDLQNKLGQYNKKGKELSNLSEELGQTAAVDWAKQQGGKAVALGPKTSGTSSPAE